MLLLLLPHVLTTSHSTQVEEILSGSHSQGVDAGVVAEDSILRAYRAAKGEEAGGDGGAGGSGKVVRKPAAGDCPICFNEMEVGRGGGEGWLRPVGLWNSKREAEGKWRAFITAPRILYVAACCSSHCSATGWKEVAHAVVGGAVHITPGSALCSMSSSCCPLHVVLSTCAAGGHGAAGVVPDQVWQQPAQGLLQQVGSSKAQQRAAGHVCVLPRSLGRCRR